MSTHLGYGGKVCKVSRREGGRWGADERIGRGSEWVVGGREVGWRKGRLMGGKREGKWMGGGWERGRWIGG